MEATGLLFIPGALKPQCSPSLGLSLFTVLSAGGRVCAGALGLRENFLVSLSWLLAHVLAVLTVSAFFN